MNEFYLSLSKNLFQNHHSIFDKTKNLTNSAWLLIFKIMW